MTATPTPIPMSTVAPYRSDQRAGRDGFAQVLHAEWTKLRTVRSWMLALAAAALMMVLVALLAGASSVQPGRPSVPIGPGGEPVTDSFYFVHQPLSANAGITVSVSALTGARVLPGRAPVIVPWAKAGLIIKDGTRPGSPYAAIMVTSGHGVRMQYDYLNDTAGLPGPVSTASPRWLRLKRSGDTVTGYDSADGAHWTEVGTVHVVGLAASVQGGLFVASPDSVQGLGTDPSVATAVFGNLAIHGGEPGAAWTGEQLGAAGDSSGHPAFAPGAFTQSGDSFTVTGTGDIAPAVRATLGGAGILADLLTGAFAALIAVIVVGALFVTAEYRHDMIHVTLAASPRRGRVLAAKAIVLGAATFIAALAGALVAVPLGERLARAHGVYLFPVTSATQLRVEVGTAALLAAASILALAVGAVVRRGAGAVTAALVAVVLPYLLVANPFMPTGVSDWLTRVTPAAAFAVQQTLVSYPQVTSLYKPYEGYFPLAPWAGFAVLAGYAAASLVVAAVVLRRRDA